MIDQSERVVETAHTKPPEQWFLLLDHDGVKASLRVVDGQLVFEGENVAASARAFFEEYREVAQRFIDEALRSCA